MWWICFRRSWKIILQDHELFTIKSAVWRWSLNKLSINKTILQIFFKILIIDLKNVKTSIWVVCLSYNVLAYLNLNLRNFGTKRKILFISFKFGIVDAFHVLHDSQWEVTFQLFKNLFVRCYCKHTNVFEGKFQSRTVRSNLSLPLRRRAAGCTTTLISIPCSRFWSFPNRPDLLFPSSDLYIPIRVPSRLSRKALISSMIQQQKRA